MGTDINSDQLQSMPRTQEEAQQQQQQQKAEEERRQEMLHSIMENAAKERLERIKLVKPEKAKAVEDKLLAMAQRGMLKESVTEGRLIGMLNQAGGGEQSKGPKVDRKRPSVFDDDD